MALVESADLVGRMELTKILHVHTSAIGMWRDRKHLIGFPEILPLGPEGQGLSMGPIWDAVEVIEWWLNWVPGAKRPKIGYLDDPQYWENRIKERKG